MTTRTEYPRPQLVRENWKNLNGKWRFAFDDQDIGIKEQWFEKEEKYPYTIEVPFVYQSKLSGIGLREPHDIVWYQKEFEIAWTQHEAVILHMGAVDYEADIYINGNHVCSHIGGHTSFEVDITDFLRQEGRQVISVRAKDPCTDESIPRGKQFWEEKSRGIWYTNTTGIWQTVWLEVVEQQHIKALYITPQFDAGKVQVDLEIANAGTESVLWYYIFYHGEKVASGSVDVTVQKRTLEKISFTADLFQEHIFRTNYHGESWAWTPETPNLFDMELSLTAGSEILDKVYSYFGMRKVEAKNGMVYLNNMPYYQKLILDQGYWPEGLLTAPSDEDYRKDIQMAKDMGFNGCRKHQKTEDPRFLHWADKMGFLVWGECANAAVFNRESVERLMIEWKDILKRDYNHPCIITWVPVNESWGVPNIAFDRQQQHFSQALYHLLHTLDTTRLVISNDGWAATDTDIVAVHNYAHGQAQETEQYQYFKETLSTKEYLLKRHSSPWPNFAEGFCYQGQPILLTEFGGIGYNVVEQSGWGYTLVESEEAFLCEYKRVLEAVLASKALWGFCYTQLTDVEQEVNGLLTYDRRPKCDLGKICEINSEYHICMVE